jgi:pilus assembly protein Flp/PilA
MNNERFKRLLQPHSPTSGQGLVEYALILVLVAVVVIVALTLTGGSVSASFLKVACTLDQSMDEECGCVAERVTWEVVECAHNTASPKALVEISTTCDGATFELEGEGAMSYDSSAEVYYHNFTISACGGVSPGTAIPGVSFTVFSTHPDGQIVSHTR